MNQKPILAEISVGELVDKITILMIKDKHLNGDKQAIVQKELNILQGALTSQVKVDEYVKAQFDALLTVNQTLWNIEDAIRLCERDQCFDETFIDLARRVYITNDQRAEIKRNINTHTGSNIAEVKSYESYE
jgi:predicted transcriptional regulator